MLANIKKWGINGEGVAYSNKKAFFIENAIPGETVNAEVTTDHGSYLKGRAVEILEPSPRRRHPLCPKWDQCGGCGLMHVDYKGQIRMKEHVLKEALRKYAGYEGEILPMIKNPEPLAYRNACKMPFGTNEDGKTCTGMYRRDTSDFVPIERCLIHSKKLEAVRQAITELVNAYGLKAADSSDPEHLKTLVLKEFNGKVHAVFVTGHMELPQAFVEEILETIPDAVSVWQSIKDADDPEYELFGGQVLHLGGEMKMTLSLDDYELDLLPKSFFQLNTKQAQALYKLIASWLPPKSGLLVEAYSGIGAISLYAADRADQAIGIEVVEDATANARSNALLNGKENLSFICGDAAQELEKIAAHEHVNTLVVDPPRSGLNDQMKKTILQTCPQNLIYVSCNPSTLAKDLAVLQSRYAIRAVQPFDFFSQTPHVESICLLTPRNIKPKTYGKKSPSKGVQKPKKDMNPYEKALMELKRSKKNKKK